MATVEEESVWDRRFGRWAGAGAFILLLGLILWAHLARLDDVPRGLAEDESSVGLNAAAIAESGRDEHGVRFPVYFRAFGEFKNPVHVYAAALVFKLAGVSEYSLRLTSALFFLVMLGGIYCLARQLSPESPAVALWAVAATGFLPWFFPMSRIAVEAVEEAVSRFPFNNSTERTLIDVRIGDDFAAFAPKPLVVHVLFNLIKNGLYFVQKGGGLRRNFGQIPVTGVYQMPCGSR